MDDMTGMQPKPIAQPQSASAENRDRPHLPPAIPLSDLDRLVHAAQARATSGLSPTALWLAFADLWMHLGNAPFRRMELAQSAAHQWRRLLETARGGQVISPSPTGHRFRDDAWRQQPFAAIHQAFLLAEEWWGQAGDGGKGVSHRHAQIVSFAIRQGLDIFSPSNIPWLNPEVIRATRDSGGRNFAAGWRNWASDLQAMSSGSPAGRGGFAVGENLAVTPGKVVFRNALMELIQYVPATATVRPEPVLIVPAWIMKYYILDLSPENSLIRHLVAEGHTVFTISWRNPGAEMRDISLEDYRANGPHAALDAIRAICGEVRVHGCGYCLGGTLLAITAAAMARDGDDRLASVSLLAAQTDFTEAGELQLFISESQLAFLDDVMSAQGYLDSRQMAGAFQMLRSNDLIWSHVIDRYMLGRTESGNDLMAWNADGTRLPARAHAQYLRGLFLDNDLAEGRFLVAGKPISVADIRVPLFVVGTEADHIAPWRSVHKIHLLNPGDITFVLTSGGHNAGIVSEPGHPHRAFRTRHHPAGEHYIGPEDWAALAESHVGSWWLEWTAWLGEHSSKATKPPRLGAPDAGYTVLADAPGQYVLEH